MLLFIEVAINPDGHQPAQSLKSRSNSGDKQYEDLETGVSCSDDLNGWLRTTFRRTKS